MEKSYRIHTDIGSDRVLNVQMRQDVDFLEVLTLKLRETDTYTLHQSGYGVIVGRVLANDAFGIPNAKVSVFVKLEDENYRNKDITAYYPYKSVQTKNQDGVRYNLLPDSVDDECHRDVGTFPNKRLVLDDDSVLEIYDHYWKYTTVTNNAGDYMIYGAPTGNCQIHVDIDLSDIGVLSQKPRDFVYKGYNSTLFDNASQFKESTNLDSLAQIISQDKNVYVYPFWGDSELGDAAITRCDVQVQYKFEPTCVFFGSVVTDSYANNIGHKCNPSKYSGYNSKLVTSEGTIEMIRKTPDGYVEEFQIHGNRLIDSDGVFCYQIPMNLDYVGTDEYGNVVPTDNPSKGIATRTRVRFRFSVQETGEEGVSRHRAKYLVPNNPRLMEDYEIPTIESGKEYEKCFEFGSATPEEYFRDLYWNKVYSVKNYIPRTQTAHRVTSNNFNALRTSNFTNSETPFPFNKLRFRLPFVYILVCILLAVVVYIITFINWIISLIESVFYAISRFRLPLIGRVFSWVDPGLSCIALPQELTDIASDYTMYIPGCFDGAVKHTSCPDDMPNCHKDTSTNTAIDRIQQKLAQDFEITNLDFYNDWVNGVLYMPLWYWRKRKKKRFLFGLFSRSAQNTFCSCDNTYSRLKIFFPCDMDYAVDQKKHTYTVTNAVSDDDDKWHNDRSHFTRVWTKYGLIKEFKNRDDLKIYYYTPGNPIDEDVNGNDITTYKTYDDPVRFVRLYATDIILMGSLNECDMDGIPQFFTRLPSTTANIPFIVTVRESQNEEKAEQEEEGGITNDGEDSGTSVVTGIDWEHDGEKSKPRYGGGLFMDLGCAQVDTRGKSCINVERMCELGVGFDLGANDINVRNGTYENYEHFADGMITRYELMDNESRAMFASLNHNGFNPKDEYTIIKKNTGFEMYRFHYLYPVDFDGRMDRFSRAYTNGFVQKTYDYLSFDYQTFKMGRRSDNEKLHFYKIEGSNSHRFPVYNNSFYFYFGLNEGSTAIDKFNKTFYAECFKNIKAPFNMDVEVTPANWCPYDISTDYGQIVITLDGITKPFAYELSDSDGNYIVSETDMDTDYIVIGGVPTMVNGLLDYEKDANGKFVKNGKVTCLHESSSPSCDLAYTDYLLENGVYNIKVTDANGKSISKLINMQAIPIGVTHSEVDLGKKFYNRVITTTLDICDVTKDYEGTITIESILIDGKEYKISNAIFIGTENNGYANMYDVYLEGYGGDGKVRLSIIPEEEEPSYDANGNVLKDAEGIPQHEQRKFSECTCTNAGVEWPPFAVVDKQLVFYIYYPNVYAITVTQYCHGELNDNVYTTTATVNNGTNLMATINTFPLRLMLGKNGPETENLQTRYNKWFKNSLTETKIIQPSVSGWLNLEKEYVYAMHDEKNLMVNDRNESLWANFIEIVDDGVMDGEERNGAVAAKFNYMFSLCEGAYMSEGHDNHLEYSSKGGRKPVVHRGNYPVYVDMSDSNNEENPFRKYDIDSVAYATAVDKYPNIVGPNYRRYWRDSNILVPILPELRGSCLAIGRDVVRPPKTYGYSNPILFNAFTTQGNYFAAFTMDAALNRSTCTEDARKAKSMERYPYNANTLISVLKCKTELLGQDGPNNLVLRNEPYFKAMFVDRRFDYDLRIWTPSPNDKRMGGGRVTGYTYNGIEMVYDPDTYDIIGEGLEYTYDTDSGSPTYGVIDYHGYDGRQRFFSATVTSENSLDLQPTYMTMITPDYPHTNIIQMPDLDIEASNYVTFHVSSCSYNMTAHSEEGLVKAQTEEGEEVEFTIGCTNHVRGLYTVNEAIAADRADFEYTGVTAAGDTGYITGATFDNFLFTLLPDTMASNTHTTRTARPRYKLFDSVNDIANEKKVNYPSGWSDVFIKEVPEGITLGDDKNPDDVNLCGWGPFGAGFLFSSNETYMFDEDNEAQRIKYAIFNPAYTRWFKISLPKPVLALKLEREYYNSNFDNLTKHIHVTDMNSVYDMKGFYIVNNNKCLTKHYSFTLFFGTPYDIYTWNATTGEYEQTGTAPDTYTHAFSETCDYGFVVYVNETPYTYMAGIDGAHTPPPEYQGGPSPAEGDYASIDLVFDMDEFITDDDKNASGSGSTTVEGSVTGESGSSQSVTSTGDTEVEVKVLEKTPHKIKCFFSMTNGAVITFTFYVDKCGMGVYRTYMDAVNAKGIGGECPSCGGS